MKKIKEIIVVEGKDDTVAIKRAVNADTIETTGSGLHKRHVEPSFSPTLIFLVKKSGISFQNK